MVVVFGKHILNEEGERYLNGAWFDEVKGIMEKQPGFISFTRETDVDNADQTVIIVKFENEDDLQAWIDHKKHSVVIADLNQYRSVPWWQAARTDDENIDWRDLQWKIIAVESE